MCLWASETGGSLWFRQSACFFLSLPFFFSLKAAKYVDMDFFYRSFLCFELTQFPHIRVCQTSFAFYVLWRQVTQRQYHVPLFASKPLTDKLVKNNRISAWAEKWRKNACASCVLKYLAELLPRLWVWRVEILPLMCSVELWPSNFSCELCPGWCFCSVFSLVKWGFNQRREKEELQTD